ncbi:MAG: hypothetical protein NZ528_00010 [Caldilineales bacterium]|nr:hypothetical protein [Caldilineales bacterium]MDW8318244.1 hypothetical protein [Anaerolineae bacterium]
MRKQLSNWRLEIILVLLAALAAFLLLERMDIRRTIWRWLQQLMAALGGLARQLADLVIPTTLSDFVGMALIIGVAVLAVWRVRWRLQRSPRFARPVCPRCGSPAKRIHRRPLDRLVNAVIPVHRYICSSADCRWRGLRVDAAKGSAASQAAAADSQMGS